MTLAGLSLVIAVGLLGPLLATPHRFRVPVVVGEIAAGVIIGRTGFRWLDPADPALTFLGTMGFAVVMLIAGSEVPVRDARLRPALFRGAGAAAAVGVVSIPAGLLLSSVAGTGHWSLYAVLMASSSAAVMMPIVREVGLTGQRVLVATVQVAIADVVAIVSLPLVEDPHHAGRAALGALAVVAAGGAVFAVMFELRRRGVILRLRRLSKRRHFGLELRWNLLILFGLGGLAEHVNVTVMLAGFVSGLMLSALGQPRRLARQLFGVGEGFLKPVFFVWLGMSVDLRELGSHPRMIGLAAALAVVTVAVHCVGRLFGQPINLAVLTSAQLGVPVAAVTIGTRTNLLDHGEGGAILAAALLSVAITGVAATLAARSVVQQPADEQPAEPA
jgi:Kef-type K+ transport system membrane component KefB